MAVFEKRVFRFYFADYSTKATILSIFRDIKSLLQKLADAYENGDSEECDRIAMEIDYKIHCGY